MEGAGQDLMRSEKVLAELRAKKQAFEESLRGLPKEFHLIPQEEHKQIVEVKGFLAEFLEAAGIELLAEKRYQKFTELTEALDRMALWKNKFSTESAGGPSDNVPLEPFNPAEDSIYYMTPSGMSLRLKTANLQEGLWSVVQQIAEKILFVGSEEVAEVPRIGFRVKEFFSDSGLDFYKRGNQIAAVFKHTEDGTYFSPDVHSGDRVNSIFFTR
ncbi:MAG: hypothetical protein A3C12_01095 [Candidatus Sungbacteria bacterium RIFCSPHIGHO2_02_FULL_49_20]|uniref:Uncharacterized protein n=1 Tax=Candidatus Sungbacteria bacterium RIFCSPHIGHO2_02_FULL_49_20 TaxID=1802272 RepID=A0A1G2KR89_9BACT|nr:MAG: hypothetical protein A3C12_01095 [Candidatus Sungbacteria bacterium RIFCSPHIGHO2_02_FULL_49_20]